MRYFFCLLFGLCFLPASSWACKTMEQAYPGYHPMQVKDPATALTKSDLVFEGVVSKAVWVEGKGHEVTYRVQKLWRGSVGPEVKVFVPFWPDAKDPAQFSSKSPSIIHAAQCENGSFGEPMGFTAPIPAVLKVLGKPKKVF